MAGGVADRDRGAADPDQLLVRADRSSRKRRRSAKSDNDEETTAHRRKSLRIQEIFNKQHQQHPQRAKPKPSRSSRRLQKIRYANGQSTARGGRSSPKSITTQQYSKQSESNQDANRVRHSAAEYTELRTATDKESFIENWLEGSSWSRRVPTENKTPPQVPPEMPRKPVPVLPSPRDSLEESTTSTSRKSERSTASVHDADYHQSLRYRNIFIECENPPPELMRKAHRILSRSRNSPEMDNATVQKLKNKSRDLRNEAEDVIVKQLAPSLIPAINEIPDERLLMNADQPWFNSVPVPLDPDVLTTPLPLPKPKPDLAFGYSEAAFTHKQLMTVDLLVDDQFGRSYAVPDQKIRFPFLTIEFKSQAKNGTHYIATNQAAGAGAIVLNGHMDLIQRSFGMENFDYMEPQFFSISIDHELARINVHWLKAPAEGRQHSFHVEGLSQHLLRDEKGIRALSRAIKNILDHGADNRLRTLCSALDAYRETVVRDREAANAQRQQGLPKPQSIRRTRRTVAPIDAPMESAESRQNEAGGPLYESQRAALTEMAPRRARTTSQGEMRDLDDVSTNALDDSRHSAIAPVASFTATRSHSGPVISGQTMSGAHHVGSDARPRHSVEVGKPKRQIRPTQKVLDNIYADGNGSRR